MHSTFTFLSFSLHGYPLSWYQPWKTMKKCFSTKASIFFGSRFDSFHHSMCKCAFFSSVPKSIQIPYPHLFPKPPYTHISFGCLWQLIAVFSNVEKAVSVLWRQVSINSPSVSAKCWHCYLVFQTSNQSASGNSGESNRESSSSHNTR